MIYMKVLELLFYRECQNSLLLIYLLVHPWSFKSQYIKMACSINKLQNDFCLRQFFSSVDNCFKFSVLHFAKAELPTIQKHIDVTLRTNWHLQSGGRILSMCLFDLTFTLNAKPKPFCISDHFPLIMPKVFLHISATFCVNDHDILKMVLL